MRVKSKKSISFPKIGWSISEGEEKEAPKDKSAQDRILSEHGIIQVEVIKKNQIKQ